MRLKRILFAAAGAVALGAALPTPAFAQKVLRVVMHSDLKIVDPIWTTAYITRNHGYMIYDTLFSLDASNEVKPQMVDSVDVSADKLTYTLKLRDGLVWHDGQPVTAEDCVASLKRWAARDTFGQKLFGSFVAETSAADARTIVIKLKTATGQLLFGLAKPSSNVPFMMPKRVAETDPNKQISEFVGSGPFVFKADEWKPGDKAVYVKFDKYKPRSEPASGLSGGKVVNVDRVEWRAISDHQQALNALASGEIDYVEQPPHDLLPLIKADANLKLLTFPFGAQFTMRLNSTQPPFDNPKIKQALWHALNQDDFMKAVVGNPEYYRGCKSYYPCGSPLSTTAGMDGLLSANAKKSQDLLKEAGYDGKPVVLMASTDLAILTNLSPVAKQLLERGGFKVDMQAMDWQTLVARRAKKDPPSAGGWNIFHTVWGNADILNPVLTAFMGANCEKAAPGWPCDEALEKLRDDFMKAPDLAAQKAAAEAVQKRAIEYTTHIPLGEYFQPIAVRNTVENVVVAPAPVFWNITKK